MVRAFAPIYISTRHSYPTIEATSVTAAMKRVRNQVAAPLVKGCQLYPGSGKGWQGSG